MVRHMTAQYVTSTSSTCPALVDQRLQHIELFSDSQCTIEAFLQQEPTELALFLRRCYNQCAALEDWGSS